ncbi:MAG TPA: 4Fe-4S dicluster domain-containing protein [bacterium]|nr:4Fe-4S dicluster domain-containing protein [bacterium]
MEKELRELAKKLLESGEADVVIGYGRHHDERRRAPVFVTDPADVEKLIFDERCLNNLAGYLNKRYKLLGAEFSKPAVVLKGCDAKAAVGLIQEAQLDPGKVTLIGVCCEGVVPDYDSADGERPFKCEICDVHRPRNTAHVVGDLPEAPALTEYRPSERAAELAGKSREERYAFWREAFSKCIRCYACRAACPLCSCERCIADSNQPQWVPTSGHELGNWSWNIVRAFHLAGRCIGCGECQRACPVGIPLDLLNQHLRRVVADRFGYVAGLDPEARPPLTTYNEKDAEEFIR